MSKHVVEKCGKRADGDPDRLTESRTETRMDGRTSPYHNTLCLKTGVLKGRALSKSYRANRESTEGCSVSMVQTKKRQVREKSWSQKEKHMQDPNWTGRGIRRSERPLSECHTRRKCSIKAPIPTKKSKKRKFQHKNATKID